MAEIKNKSISELEVEFQKREDEYYVTCQRNFQKQLDEEKTKFNNKVTEIKKSYDYCVITFVFMLSFISVIMYRNIKYDVVNTYLKTNYPYIHEKTSYINYDINTYNIFECSLIIASYHYIMYKIIINRFLVMFMCGICCMYMCFQLKNN